jgi:hypothetical protein
MIFIPIPTKELIDYACIWNQRRSISHNSKKPHEIVVYDTLKGYDNLSRLANDEVLYIHGHGGRCDQQNRHVIGDKKTNRTLNSEELAIFLQRCGLNKNHRSIKLWTCRSATSLRGDKHGQSLAYELFAAMKKLGYNNLQVFGYTGFVNIIGPGNSKGVHFFRWDTSLARKKYNRAKLHRICIFKLDSKIGKKIEHACNDKIEIKKYYLRR